MQVKAELRLVKPLKRINYNKAEYLFNKVNFFLKRF